VWFAPVIWILLMGLLVWLAIVVSHYDPAANVGPRNSKNPCEILDERYARGEIDAASLRHDYGRGG